MNRIFVNMKYKIGYQLSWVAWYLIIYIGILTILYYSLIKSHLINPGEGSLVYRLWGSVIVMFAWTMRFREDFDFWLTMSHNRRDIFLSLTGVAAVFSMFFSSLIVLERIIVDVMNKSFGFFNITDPFHMIAPYHNDNLFQLFIFFLVLCYAASILGLLLGSLFYRFGKKFTLAFWLIFSSIPVIFFPALLWSGRLSRTFSEIGLYLRAFDVWAASVNIFLFAVILSALSYLNIRRLPQQ
jgi:hypothetical protein